MTDPTINLDPARADAELARGLTLKAQGRLAEARAAFDLAIAFHPASVAAHVNRAAVLQQLGDSRQALESAERAIELQPGFAPAHCNRGLALHDLGRPLEALDCYDRALSIDPGFAAAHGNRGNVLQALDRPADALAAYQRVMELQPAAAQAYVNAAHALLLLGHFEHGWALYEWRKRVPVPLANRTVAAPLWLGASELAGKTILLHWEQGLGDTFQFCRYAPLVRKRGAHVILMVQKGLVRLVRTLDPAIQVRADSRLDESPGKIDCHCPLLSLPRAFHTDIDTIPAMVPYLQAEPALAAQWRERIGGAGFKVGIHWQGNHQSPADRGRSFPLRQFHPLSTIPGIRLISLQIGAGTEQLRHLPHDMRVENLGPEFDSGPDAFLDSAAALASLDLVITSDTALAHLAGALGCPVWVVLQQAADWRWLRGREDCPWYPGMRLFRQRQRGNWDEVFEEVRAALVARAGLPAVSESP
jgi:Tfp pilus assembly protein PilF